MLLGVIFGYKISDSDRQLIKDFCIGRPNSFFKKAILHDDKFVLKIVDA